MPFSTISVARDIDEYKTANRRACVEVTATVRGSFTATITRIDLHKLRMQRGQESLPRIRHAEPSPERNIIAFLTGEGPGTVRNGVEFRPGDLALLSPRHPHRYRSFAPVAWAGMSLPLADMAAIGASVAGRDLMPREDEEIVTPPPAAMAKLQRLHAAAGHLAEHAPEVIADPEAARGLEQALVGAMVECLVLPDRREDSAVRRRHTLIMQRFHEAVEASADSAVDLPEVCLRIGASGRSLRLCCQEYLGMSPGQYLLRRRLHLARRALREAVPGRTVTEVAMNFGFWELGRFALRYKALFGESPSATRKRALDRA